MQEILDIARQAGEILLKHFHHQLKVTYKENNEHAPVTIADTQADQFLREQIKLLFPNDEILSEENEQCVNNWQGRVWCIDPLDGTRTFIEEKPEFSVAIGLCENTKPILGVVYAPATSELYYAKKGEGAWFEKAGQKQQLTTIKSTELSKAIRFQTTRTTGDLNALLEELPAKNVERIGSAALKIVRVAKNEQAYYVHNKLLLSKWDTCAAQCILEEAGGILTSLHGKPLNYAQKEKTFTSGVSASSSKELHLTLTTTILKLQDNPRT